MRDTKRMSVVLSMVLSLSACRPKPDASSMEAGTGVASSATVAVAPAGPKPLPPEPVAALKGDAGPVPLKSLSDVPSLKGIWEPKRRADLKLLLTGVSAYVEHMQEDGRASIDAVFWQQRIKPAKLDDAVLALGDHVAVNGVLPEEFLNSLKEYLVSVKAEPHLGVWVTKEQNPAWFDYSGLATWIYREDPAYSREHIAARAKVGGSPFGWALLEKKTVYWRLAWEDKALAWLGMQLERQGKTLEPAELARFEIMQKSPLGAPQLTENVDIADLISDYKANEVRADTKYKNHIVRVFGTAREIKKDAFDAIYIVMDQGNQYSVPNVHCRVSKAYALKAADINRTDKVSVRGRVAGQVLTGVMLEDCEIDE